MNKNILIETLGSVTKEEQLNSLSPQVAQNSFVVEVHDPFPGYHGDIYHSGNTSPNNVFFILKSWLPTEKLFRAVKNINKYLSFNFDATPAEIKVFNYKYDAIRIKGLESFQQISELIACFKDEGLEFQKHKTIEQKCIIKIKKYMLLKKISEGVWSDCDNEAIHYLELPLHLKWKAFEEITYSIKRNSDYTNFDAASGVIFRKSGLLDMVRIYDLDCKLENLQALRDKYLEQIHTKIY